MITTSNLELTAPELAITRDKLGVLPAITCQGRCRMTHTILPSLLKHSYCQGCDRDWVYDINPTN